MAAIDRRARDVLTFWFEETDPKQQFRSDPDFDETIRARFGDLHTEAAEGTLDAWMETSEGALALIIVLDQFSRNLYRGRGEAFAQDEKARALARTAVERGHDTAVAPDRRAFFYMPFMHAEDLHDQDRCIELIKARLGEGSGNLPHAKWHRDVIEKFGRFPFRNAALGRETTLEEARFLNKEDTPG